MKDIEKDPFKEAVLFIIRQRCENLKENPFYQEEYNYLVELFKKLKR